MAENSHQGVEGGAEDTDELLYNDLDDSSSVFGMNPPPLKLDHCDLLLDAIDAQLSQLQVPGQNREPLSRKHKCSDLAPLSWSQSISKDTGLGSTTQTNDSPISCLDLVHTKTKEQPSESNTGSQEGPSVQKQTEKTEKKMDRMTRGEEDVESRREQCIWRLGRLLGDACSVGKFAGELHPPSDSICTEDFVRRFREEMVRLPLADGSRRQPDEQEEAARTEISDSASCQSDQKRESAAVVRRKETEKHWSSCRDAENSHHPQTGKPDQRDELEKCPCDSYGVRISSASERAGAGESCKASQKLGDHSSISGPPCSSHKKEVLTEHETLRQNKSRSPKARSLAGVPVWSFDTVSIDSDLDSVCTQQVRQHIHSRPGWHSLIQSVRDVDGLCTDQSDYDTPTQEPSEPQYASVLRSSHAKVNGGSQPLRKAQRNRRDAPRCVRSLGADDEDTDEGHNCWSGRCRSDETSAARLDKMKSDCLKTERQLSILRKKCEKEEETLKLKKTHLSEVELSLSELKGKKKHALQELECLSAETAQMEKERRSLETSLKDKKVEMDSISFQLCKLQRQRDSCRQEVRIVEEELATQRRMALEDGVCMERKQTSVVVSVLEREEMERQLDSAKTELFAEQRRARDKLDSMQEKLEEAREELQRVTEEESSLRHRCACLEEKQRQRQAQMEALDCQVSELKGELGECMIKVGSLEKILAQRELQLLVLQEEHSDLETERDGLQGELQNLRKQHGTALKEAQEQANRVMMAELEQKSKELALAHEQQIQTVHKKAEEEKASALTEQALSLKRHIESMQSSIKLKQEEARELRESLEQQWKMAKKREEKLHADALEKVHKAIVEERRKWEAEKLTAVQMHCGILEEQSRKSLERVRSEVEQEKRNALALQNKVVELQTRVQELESEACMQKSEQESVLAVMCQSLKEEHQVELQRLHKRMEQERQQQVVKLEQAVQLAEEEADSLRKLLGENGSSHKQATARLEQQLRHWACELGAECQHLRLLLEQSGARGATVQLPHSPTMAEALQNLQTLREQLEHKIRHLKQGLDSQKQTHEQLIQDKERELHIQREQMGMERDQALDFLKERLIKEHIEDLSSLNRAHICEGGDEGKGVAASLRKQLKAKDLELRQVQRSMSEWKDQTAARLARKFEEELTAELERKMSKSREDFQEKPETPEGEMTVTARQCNDSGAQYSVSHPSSHAASPTTSDMTSFKLLRHLQSRVKQLRAENQASACSPSLLKRIPFDLSGSYLETITQSQDSVQIQSHPSIRMVPS